MSAPDIGVHLLTHAGSRPDWVKEAVDSLAGEPVALTLIEDHGGHIGRRRTEGFRLSTGRHEFVSFVDSDDRALPGVFQRCADALRENPEAAMAFTLEERIDAVGNVIGGPPEDLGQMLKRLGPARFAFHHAHHVCVYRLAVIEPYLDEMAAFPFMAESVLHARLLLGHPAVLVPVIGYQWRQHPGQASRAAVADPDQCGAAIRHLCPLLQAMAR